MPVPLVDCSRELLRSCAGEDKRSRCQQQRAVGIDIPSVVGSALAIQASVRARVSLRVPPGVKASDAQDALIEHLRSRVPWNLRCSVERVASGDPFVGSRPGSGFEALKAGLEESYGKPMTTAGQGGSIPLCNVFQQTFPDAEIMLYGVEEPTCLIHAPNESVAPSEIEHIGGAVPADVRSGGRSRTAALAYVVLLSDSEDGAERQHERSAGGEPGQR